MTNLKLGKAPDETLREAVLRLLRWAGKNGGYISRRWIGETLQLTDTTQINNILNALKKQDLVCVSEKSLNGCNRYEVFSLSRPIRMNKSKSGLAIAWQYMVEQSVQKKSFQWSDLVVVAKVSENYAKDIIKLLGALGAIEYVDGKKTNKSHFYIVAAKNLDKSTPKIVKENGRKVASWL